MIWEKVLQKDAVPQWLLLGPIALLCTLALSQLSLDLFSIGILGLYLSARWHLKGLIYALSLLALASVIHHLLLSEGHFWQLGLEISVGIAFFITALSFEQNTAEFTTLSSQLEAKQAVICNLEEELGKEKEEGAKEKISLQEKVSQLQKEFEEVQGEQSSIFILNDVLRKTTARHLEEKRAAEQQTLLLRQELVEMRRERERLSNESELVRQNRQLLEELNATRIEKEQICQTHDALIKTHAKEASKARKMEEQLTSVSEERNFLKERLASAEIASIDPQSQQKLHRTEMLYRQLKVQFEEKDRLLHQTRAERFQADTALQALKIEFEQQGSSREMEKELEKLEKEIASLQQENQELLGIISHLNENP